MPLCWGTIQWRKSEVVDDLHRYSTYTSSQFVKSISRFHKLGGGYTYSSQFVNPINRINKLGGGMDYHPPTPRSRSFATLRLRSLTRRHYVPPRPPPPGWSVLYRRDPPFLYKGEAGLSCTEGWSFCTGDCAPPVQRTRPL